MEQKVISFYYKLTNTEGQTLDSSKDGAPFSFIAGAGQIIPGLEEKLLGLKAGDKQKISVSAAEAYGVRNESLVLKVPRTEFPSQEIKVGDRFRGGPDSNSPLFGVIQVTDLEVTLDGNHPLAGQDLVFEVELVGTREATTQELEHRHAHGEHGHSH